MYTVYYKKVEAKSGVYRYSAEKDAWLLKERNVCFQNVIDAIDKGFVEVVDHHNQERYPNQQIFMVFMFDYVYSVPIVVEENGDVFLKTIIPSRKAKKRYLKKGEFYEIEKEE